MIGQQEDRSKTSLGGSKIEENSHGRDESHTVEIRSDTWWTQRSSFERVLVILCTLLFVFCTTLVILSIVSQSRLRIAERIASQTCRTKECIKAASRILERMDPSTEPCENFYEFSCGNYLRHHTVPDDHHLRSTLQTMQDDIYVTLKKLIERPILPNETGAILKVKKLYASCMNMSNIEGGSGRLLQQLLTNDGVGSWPILFRKWDEDEFLLEWRLAMLFVHQVQPFFHTFVMPDSTNASVYQLHLYSGSPILNVQYYLNNSDPDYVRYMESYKNLIAETARLLKAPEDVVKRDIDAVLEFEMEFANLTQDDPLETMNETNTGEDDFQFNRVNITALEMLIPEIKWVSMIDYIFDYIGLSGKQNDLNIVLHCEKYLRNLILLLRRTPPRTIANYLSWRFVAKYLPYLDIHFRRLYYDFRREVPNLSEERTFFARWKECVHLVNDGFGMAVASIYVREEFGDHLEKEIKVLIESLKTAFIRSLQQQHWLDSDTKVLCKEKVQAMNTKLAFPRYILDPDELDTDYSGLEVLEEHFLENILKMNRYEVKKELNKTTRTVRKDRDWFVQPLVVNAFYEVTGNSVLFPVGILRNPIFSLDRPRYLNYGMLGVVIGHEITHAFDSSGRKFDKVGNLTQWWSDEIVDKFKEQAACFIDQYSQLPLEMVGQNVNGNITLDDNICDNSGLQQAFRAYLKYESENGEEPSLPGISFSNSQIFFLQYAQIWCEVLSKEANERYIKDSHSPGKYRANIPLMNSPEFSSVFNCPVGTPMNPVKKCKLWG